MALDPKHKRMFERIRKSYVSGLGNPLSEEKKEKITKAICTEAENQRKKNRSTQPTPQDVDKYLKDHNLPLCS